MTHRSRLSPRILFPDSQPTFVADWEKTRRGVAGVSSPIQHPQGGPLAACETKLICFFVSGITSFHHINTTQPKQHVRSIQPKTSTPMLAVVTQAVSIEPVLRSPLLRRRPNHVPNYSTIFLGLLYRPGLFCYCPARCAISPEGATFSPAVSGGVGFSRSSTLIANPQLHSPVLCDLEAFAPLTFHSEAEPPART